MKGWWAEHVSILTQRRKRSQSRRDGDIEEEDSVLLPPGLELVLPVDTSASVQR